MFDDKMKHFLGLDCCGAGRRRERRIEDAMAGSVDQRVEHRLETPPKDVRPRDATLASHDNDEHQSHAITLHHELRSLELRKDVSDGRKQELREFRLREYRLPACEAQCHPDQDAWCGPYDRS